MTVVSALALAGALSAACDAADKNPQRDLDRLRVRLEALQKKLASSQESKNEAADALRESEHAISEANRRLRDLGEQQRAVDARLTDLGAQSRRVSAGIEARQAQLARLLYQRYTGAQPDALKLLLSGEDPNQIARELYYLGYLSRAHADIIRGLRVDLQQLDQLSQATRRRSAELDAIRTEQQAQRKRLGSEQQARQQVLLRVSRQIEKQRREISTLKRNEERLTRLVEQLGQVLESTPLRNDRLPDAGLSGIPFAQLKGKLSLPVRGELRNRFGSQREDSGLAWKGLFIAAPDGQDVRAIAAGRVVFSDWLRGFGNLLIIDHGGGYMSLYANNEALLKRVGDAVRSGEPVAQVGASGGSEKSGLYFELRYRGKAFDPLDWVSLR
ncbi:MAG TPA: peptidoglycan DD-metalloendopeptidase family protein [Burkholderiales bacterium]|nr:peptidoglycan DD-metalloendopeptidase family protein [Burkholderiales bacterium]